VWCWNWVSGKTGPRTTIGGVPDCKDICREWGGSWTVKVTSDRGRFTSAKLIHDQASYIARSCIGRCNAVVRTRPSYSIHRGFWISARRPAYLTEVIDSSCKKGLKIGQGPLVLYPFCFTIHRHVPYSVKVCDNVWLIKTVLRWALPVVWDILKVRRFGSCRYFRFQMIEC
jgi:hypothetical protein